MSERWPQVAQLARELAGSADRSEVAATLLKRLESAFRPAAIAIAFEEGDAEVALPLQAKPGAGELYRPFLTLALRRGMLRLDGAEAASRLGLITAPAAHLLLVPLAAGQARYGAFLLGGPAARWTEEDQALAEGFASVAAAVIAQQARAPAAAMWSRVADGLGIALAVVDRRGRVAEANRAFGQLVRSAPTAITGWPWIALVPPAWGDGIARVLGAGERERPEVELKASGRTFIASAFTMPGASKGERVLMLDDQTERRRLQEQLFQSEKMSTIGQLIAGVAHELNNPLTSVVGFADFLSEQANVPAGLREPLEVLRTEAERASTVVKNLLRFARRHEPERKRLPIKPVIEGVASLLRGQLMSQNVELTLEFEADLPELDLDPQRLTQVFLNLINNSAQAITATGRPGVISLKARKWHSGVAVDVRDSGPGMVEGVAAQAFEPFYTTKAEGQGTGLGLSIAQGIVREHGGHIALTTSPGEGATFTVELPATGAPRRSDPAVVLAEPRGPLKVLVVDDEPHILHYLRATLESWGHQVVTAGDGAAALETLREASWDVIVTDLRMPRVSGREFFEALSAERPELVRRVVFSTGDTVRGDTLAFLERQGRPVLHKPFSLSDLRAALAAAAP
ncbi:MAG: ATP-binding protein [Gemmatimonadota bacterium]